MGASHGAVKVGGPWSLEDLDLSNQPPLKLHEGPISFDARDGRGIRPQYGGRTPAQEMQHLEDHEADAYAAILQEKGLPAHTAGYPSMTTPEEARSVLAKIRQNDILLWDGAKRVMEPAVSKGFPGASTLHVASMPGSDTQVYNDVALACLEDSVSFGIVYEGNWQSLWFRVWKRLQRHAADEGKQLLVLTKEDGSIGFNQTIEVTFFKASNILFKHMTAKSLVAQMRPLIQAAWYGQDSKVAALLRGEQVAVLLQQREASGQMPLHRFACLGKIDFVKSALDARAQIDAPTFSGVAIAWHALA